MSNVGLYKEHRLADIFCLCISTDKAILFGRNFDARVSSDVVGFLGVQWFKGVTV